MAQKNPRYEAEIINYSLRIPKDGKAPYVTISFCYEDEGKNYITYRGSLSDKAKKYTLERLSRIGYKGDLSTYEQMMDFLNQRANLTTTGITISLKTEIYNGKERLKVAGFWAPEVLTDDEKINIAKNALRYVLGGDPKKPVPNHAPTAPPKPAPKPKPKQDLTKQFKRSEALPSFEDDSEDDAPF